MPRSLTPPHAESPVVWARSPTPPHDKSPVIWPGSPTPPHAGSPIVWPRSHTIKVLSFGPDNPLCHLKRGSSSLGQITYRPHPGLKIML